MNATTLCHCTLGLALFLLAGAPTPAAQAPGAPSGPPARLVHSAPPPLTESSAMSGFLGGGTARGRAFQVGILGMIIGLFIMLRRLAPPGRGRRPSRPSSPSQPD